MKVLSARAEVTRVDRAIHCLPACPPPRTARRAAKYFAGETRW